MANPRRIILNPANNELPIYTTHFQPQTRFSTLHLFLKKPQSFPILLSIFLTLTWVFLKIHQPTPTLTNQILLSTTNDQDQDANIIRFTSTFPSLITKDTRGWMVDPVAIALGSGVDGGASVCASMHVGEIRPGGLRGNHRHYDCNETLLIWGAKTVFRLENKGMEKGYAQVMVGEEEVAVGVSPAGTAHALVNVDSRRSTFIIGCQDRVVSYNKSNSDFRVWEDLNS